MMLRHILLTFFYLFLTAVLLSPIQFSSVVNAKAIKLNRLNSDLFGKKRVADEKETTNSLKRIKINENEEKTNIYKHETSSSLSPFGASHIKRLNSTFKERQKKNFPSPRKTENQKNRNLISREKRNLKDTEKSLARNQNLNDLIQLRKAQHQLRKRKRFTASNKPQLLPLRTYLVYTTHNFFCPGF